MFQNIGKKIKTVAIVIMITGILLAVLGGLVAFFEEYSVGNIFSAFLTFLTVAGLGILFSWLSVFILYGFGELVDQSMAMTQRQEEILRLLKEQKGTAPRQEERPQPSVRPQPEYPTRPQPQTLHSKSDTSAPVSELDRKLPLRAAEEKPRVPSPEEETDSDEPELYIPEK
jgi:predicted PurR-regulated permease PerM